ncbi:MFS transporter [bacterium]|nr:MFS transporter [bacterium]
MSSSKTIWAWSLYDFANSAFTTLIVTFVYATFFAKGIAPDETTGTNLWSTGITLSAIIVALLSPFLGALADKGGYRKRFLGIATVVCIAASIALFFPQKGEVYFALTVFVIANVAFEMANVFYNAFLPDIAPLEKIGRVSGYGWALGYAGGLLCMVAGLFLLVQPDPPLFGLDASTDQHIRATNLLVAAWFALFSIPMFWLVKDRKVANPPPAGQLVRGAMEDLKRVFNEVKKFRQVFRLLLARLIYNDGLVTIFGFGGLYASVVFDFTVSEIIVFGIALNLAAGIGAWAFGFMDDKLGGKPTILASLVGLVLAALVAVFTTSVFWFWVSGIGVGLLAGPNQSASRSLLGRFTPPKHENEFYGFFAFSGKFTAFLGPFMLGKLTLLFDSMRAGIAVVVLLFVVGGFLLLRVDEKEGVASSGRI